jgi:hypothetical protein
MKNITECNEVDFEALKNLGDVTRRTTPAITTSTNKVNTYEVLYTKAIGGDGFILVRAHDMAESLVLAKICCFTGSHFRDSVVTDKKYISPKDQR